MNLAPALVGVVRDKRPHAAIADDPVTAPGEVTPLHRPVRHHRLFVTENTVKTHVTSLFNKLGVDSRAQAVAVAAHDGLLEAGTPRAAGGA